MRAMAQSGLVLMLDQSEECAEVIPDRFLPDIRDVDGRVPHQGVFIATGGATVGGEQHVG